MNTQEKQKILENGQKHYFRMQTTIQAFKIAFLIFPLGVPIAFIFMLFIAGKEISLQEIATWKDIVLVSFAGVVSALIVVCWTWLEKVDLTKKSGELVKKFSTNEEKIKALKDLVGYDYYPTESDLNLLSKIQKLEIKNEKIQFDLDILKIKKN